MQHFTSGWDTAWIDLSDQVAEGVFLWRDGVLATEKWTNWLLGVMSSAINIEEMPRWIFNRIRGDNAREDCVQILRKRGGLWNDASCSSRTQALCERRDM